MLTLIPRKPMVPPQSSVVEFLITIDPGELSSNSPSTRPALNIGLALDRSGSMAPEMELTRQAARRAISMLGPTDELSLVIFDHEVETLYQGKVTERKEISALLDGLEARGNTNLFGGWARAAERLSGIAEKTSLSRVILLTDGLANEGIVEPEVMAAEVAKTLGTGVQTTTLGFGGNYNEALLRKLAVSGGGNHAFVQNGQKLSTFFEEEMTSLLRTQGTLVRLSIDAPARIEWLNELPRKNGVAHLPNLVPGEPLAILVSLEVDAAEELSGEVRLAEVEVGWFCLVEGAEKSARAVLQLPVVSFEEWMAAPGDPRVEKQLARTQAERMRQAAARAYEHDLRDTAMSWVERAAELPHLDNEERLALKDLRADLERGDYNVYSKKAAMYSHGHGHGHARISTHYIEEHQDTGTAPRKRGKLPLGDGPVLFRPLTTSPVEWHRVAGMLLGHFYGERLVRGNRSHPGEGSVLTLGTLELLLANRASPVFLARNFCGAQVQHPTTSLQKLRRNFSNPPNVYELGSESAGCAALRRICPFLLSGHRYAHLDALAATMVTHRDNAALMASVGYLTLLNDLLQLPSLPDAEFYGRTFIKAIEGLATGEGYSVRNKAFGNWSGHFDEYVAQALKMARFNKLTIAQAVEAFGSGPYLLEVVPLMLYILELHAADPWTALDAATTGTQEADTLGMLVGACVGALHGPHRGWFLSEEQEQMIDRCRVWKRA